MKRYLNSDNLVNLGIIGYMTGVLASFRKNMDKQDSLDVAELLALVERGARYRYNDKAVERLIKYAVANAPCPSELDTGLKDNEDCNHGLDESICVECWRQALQR